MAYQCKASSHQASKSTRNENQTRTESTALASLEQNYFTLENGLKIPIKAVGKVSYCVGIDGRRLEVAAFSCAKPVGMSVVQGEVNTYPKLVEVLRDTG